ncbi:hypothetical protein AVEN_236198-1 [Araneus ventricosus]|uniref:Uncharacterized protein n=1 Tax=Araneus ventricosus TaxID=182803 RepID=A0A4Y2NNS1_ARAVE|nr:hypothetical protein AVEN_236198-1 [Araneus ventricosus]
MILVIPKDTKLPWHTRLTTRLIFNGISSRTHDLVIPKATKLSWHTRLITSLIFNGISSRTGDLVTRNPQSYHGTSGTPNKLIFRGISSRTHDPCNPKSHQVAMSYQAHHKTDLQWNQFSNR